MTAAWDLARQARWEGECSRRGEEAFWQSEKADQIDSRLAREIVPPLIERIETLQEEAKSLVVSVGQGGRLAGWCWPIQRLGAREMAVLTLKAGLRAEIALEGADKTPSLTALAQSLGRMVRDEVELATGSKPPSRRPEPATLRRVTSWQRSSGPTRMSTA